VREPSRIAILGLGSIGLRHARNLLAMERRVIGFDPDPARRRALEAAGGATVAERAAALDGAFACIIASPNACHLDDASAAVAAGCHVLVEKPLAHTTQGVAALLRRAREERLVFAVAHNLRFHACVERARGLLARGDLGQILWGRMIAASYLPKWRPEQDYRVGYAADSRTGGVIFDVIHEFDLAAHLLGAVTTKAAVARRSGTLDIGAEDIADILLETPHSAFVSLHIDYVTRPPLRVTEIAGTRAALRLDLIARRFTHVASDGSVLADEAMPGDFDRDYRAEMQDFLTAAENDRDPRCDGCEALQGLEQVLAARRFAGLPQ
jgi:predicted dehydrogenase